MLDFESKGSGFDPYKVYPGIFQKVVNYGCLMRLWLTISSSLLQDLGKWPKPDVHSRPSDGDVKWRSREQDLGFSVVSVLRISVVFLWDESW